MLFKELAKMCREHCTLRLIDETDDEGTITRQFMFVGAGAYPMDGMPVFTDTEELLCMMDVPKDKQKEYVVTHSNMRELDEGLRCLFMDNHHSDRHCGIERLTIALEGVEKLPIRTDYGLVTIDPDALKPVADSKKTSQPFARVYDRNVTIIIKNGMLMVAAIMPSMGWALGNGKLLREMADIAEAMDRAWAKEACVGHAE